ncbi:MAG: hypothetical protein ACXACX_21255 [Candidatus Hodarchaeales archaeon]|jgi:hypothetical protein
MCRKIIEKIKEIVDNTPANVGIFCSSYTILNELNNNGIFPMIRETGKRLFMENPRRSASKNSDMLRNFKTVSKPPNKVFFSI